MLWAKFPLHVRKQRLQQLQRLGRIPRLPLPASSAEARMKCDRVIQTTLGLSS